ncbi:helix-turn-helix domain-containing protein [Lutibacter flavus]|mgnify:CR=1 FL=1|jgi:repressor LexA|uniref:Helix-turn-helix n=1 Tax=Lutibacter flavus TaxID=691689 RepID=A0A238VHH4_9FLAO|nr:Helix-turn-helix [Lutibacter flavus]
MLLKELLKSKGVKQNWLAQRIGVSTVTMSNWVKGKSHPSKKNLMKLSEVLNVHLNDLVN